MHDHDDLHGEVGWLDPDAALQAGEDVDGLESIALRSVGIDIGSSTSHLVFSHLTLRREGAALSTRYAVTERRVVHRSPIILTPYLYGTRIDVEALTDFVHQGYRDAGLTSDDIDTGAVVITGEALKKENARPLVEFFARDSGKFICASAGPNHEALLAAYGSGAVDLSRAEQVDVLNVDIGGGTTKLTLIRAGAVVQTAAVEVGARLLAFDEAGRVVRVEEPARAYMHHLGGSVALGDTLDDAQRERFAGLMAEVLLEVLRGGPCSALTRERLLTEPLPPSLASIRHLVFSGGVSEYIYGHEAAAYGDLGPQLAAAIHRELAKLDRPDLLREPLEGIRATVIGAGEYTVQVSGLTSYLSEAAPLPAFGLKVIRPLLDSANSVPDALAQALAKFDLDQFGPGLALAIAVPPAPDYRSLRRLAEGIAAAIAPSADPRAPLFLILDLDEAASLGSILKEELGTAREVVVVDGVDVGDLDYLDIGQPVGASQALPVTVKSLLFPNRADIVERGAPVVTANS